MADPDSTDIVAWGWRCTGMKGMALGHLKPTPENTHKFEERNTQVFPLVVKPDGDVLSSLTDHQLATALAKRIRAKRLGVELAIDETLVDIGSDDFGISFYFDSDGSFRSKYFDFISTRGERFSDE